MERIKVSEGEKKETDKENLPNIIAIQLESFFDPTNVRGLVFSDDPIPNFRKLMAGYSSGMYTVPSVGAGTANTEFETLTGMSMRYFGAGEYPYKSVLKEETCESAAYDLGNIGYTSHAIHNNEANFYSRRSVYANLGFNTFTSEEYMDTQTDVNENGWMRDHNLTKYIKQCMESTDNQDFIFTVSVQGHGPYPEEPVSGDPAITVTGAATDEQNCMWEYYANQIYEMDQFIGGLITWLETQDEDVVLLLYGDHL
ncbi:MAG: LTA synthase family protein, partial [Petrimonas sp.]|nr:LTA synthase family protein [Petrimonas sp.]